MTGVHPNNGKFQIDDELLKFKKEFLLKEYEMLRQQMEKHDTQITQLRGFLLAFLGLYFGWIFTDLNCQRCDHPLFNFYNNKGILFVIPVFITLFFAINEGFIQYWKDRAVNRFKYLECRIMYSLKKTNDSGCWKSKFLSIIGPNLRLIKEPKNINEFKNEDEDWTKYYFYDQGLLCQILIVIGKPYFSVFYLFLILIFGFLAFYKNLDPIIQFIKDYICVLVAIILLIILMIFIISNIYKKRCKKSLPSDKSEN